LRSFSFEKRMTLQKPSTTDPLNPGATLERMDRLRLQVEDLALETMVSPEIVHYLINRRGEEALVVLHLMQLFKEGSEQERLWQAEAKFCIENEMCMSLVDFYCRRSPLFLFRKDHGQSYAPKIASLFAQSFSRGDGAIAQQYVKQLQTLIEHEMSALQK
jgi:glycerol-3-phosphate dehydrogenase